MRSQNAGWLTDRRGLAAIEFALVAPMLLLMLGGVIDFGLVTVGKSQLGNGIAQGVHYALLLGPSVTGTNVSAIVKAGVGRAGVTEAVTVTVTGPACYCLQGQPVVLVTPSTTMSASRTCVGSCPPNAATPSAYLVITASYVYQPLMPFYSQISTRLISKTVTVRVL